MTFRLTLFFATLITLALVHIVASEFFLYWRYMWLDMPMHFFGGVASALGLSILPFLRISFFERHASLPAYLLGVLCIGVAWEVFEYTQRIVGPDANRVLDTAVDIIFDICGACIGYVLIRFSKGM